MFLREPGHEGIGDVAGDLVGRAILGHGLARHGKDDTHCDGTGDKTGLMKGGGMLLSMVSSYLGLRGSSSNRPWRGNGYQDGEFTSTEVAVSFGCQLMTACS